ncbi:hypothetical protein HHK36_014121 [Tetracentron sinense]|uniref:HAT C-terminal dimerisation domain-containing protein n=1 Tax=Tetracentron sinense TaxID=13715 RepID=A0A835DHZ4_TETSI|nr:hypothetical protein HHK36_014121 [Tetracentron sinense]
MAIASSIGCKICKVREALEELFHDYSMKVSSSSMTVVQEEQIHSTTQEKEGKNPLDEYRLFVLEEEDTYEQVKSELDIYLGEGVLCIQGDFDVLQWWMENSLRFRVLSRRLLLSKTRLEDVDGKIAKYR